VYGLCLQYTLYSYNPKGGIKLRKNRIIVFGLLICLMFVMVGCGSSNSDIVAAEAPVPAVAAEPTPTPAPTEAEAPQEQVQQAEAAAEEKQAEAVQVQAEQTQPVAEEEKQPKEDTKAAEQQKDALVIEGPGVKKTAAITLDEIKGLKDYIVEDDYFSLNNYGTKKYFHFKGVSVWQLIDDKAGVKEGAASVSFIAEDGYIVTYTIDEIKREDYIDEQNPDKKYKVIIAWEEEGKEYNSEEGKPFKLVIGQKEPGDINKPNWVQNVCTIKVE
jgi:DMSO/TMAO reductase YedYZ molybdopterin-dependent catalytic subunit